MREELAMLLAVCVIDEGGASYAAGCVCVIDEGRS